jgi:hypothetical protein
MSLHLSEHESVRIVEEKWGIQLRRVTSGEYKSDNGCPFCGDGGKGARSDRFRLFVDGNPRVWCRGCDYVAFVNNLREKPLSAEERRQLAIVYRQNALERKQNEDRARIGKLEQLHLFKPHLQYHKALTGDAVEYWYNEGVKLPTINDFMLGYCARCPTDYEGRPSYTIPVMAKERLQNVRHRLIGAVGGDKYRPQMAGLGNQLFNLDSLSTTINRVVIWEGEKKTIVLSQYLQDSAHIGIMGKSGWNDEWSEMLLGHKDVVIALDPDANKNAHKIGKQLFNKGVRNIRIAHFPLKPDDAIVKYGAREDDIRGFIERAVPL